MPDATPPSTQVTQLLVAWGKGDELARDQLMSVVYEELHKLAQRYMRRESPGHTLQTSALVNEAFVRLVDQKNVRWQNRAHFFAIAAQMIRKQLWMSRYLPKREPSLKMESAISDDGNMAQGHSK